MKPITKYAAIMTLAGTMAGCNSQMPQQTAGIDQQVNTLYEKMTNERARGAVVRHLYDAVF
ncbi:MAG: hypothetical protein K5685_02715 [Bacteroidales bacterium]|nr:hypothetical protein [Bacteroidales bacterium]